MGKFYFYLAWLGSFILLSSLTSYSQTAIPNEDNNNPKFLGVAGEGLSTMAGEEIKMWIGLSRNTTNFTLEIYDGDSGDNWDLIVSGVDQVNFTLYADPNKDGTGSTVIASATQADFVNNAWAPLVEDLPVSALARSPVGNYFYRLEVNFDAPTAANDLNSFKVRVIPGQLSFLPGNFGFIGGPIAEGDPNIGEPGNEYDGDWRFYVNVQPGATSINFTDGDADYRLDTDNPGIPGDDTDISGRVVTPDIRYELLDPFNTQVLLNTDPSGNQEWETQTYSPGGTITPGMYTWHWWGMDGHNLNFINAGYEIFGSSDKPLAVAGLEVIPDYTGWANPDGAVLYPHLVRNLENFNDVIDFVTTSDQGWTVTLLENDGVTPLTDTDGDGLIDTGVMLANTEREIIVRIDVPAGTPLGTIDTTTIEGSSTVTEASYTATDTTEIISGPPPPPIPVKIKPIYLHTGDILNTTPPTGTTDVTLSVPSGGSNSWSQTPAFVLDFRIMGAIEVRLYLENPNPSDAVASVEVSVGGNPIGDSVVNIIPASSEVAEYIFKIYPYSIPTTVSQGNALTLTYTSNNAGTVIHYDSTSYPSRLRLVTNTYINIETLDTYNDAYPAGTTEGSFLRGETCYIRAEISSPFGTYDIESALVTIVDPNGLLVVDTDSMPVVASSSSTNTYEYAYSIPDTAPLGTYNITLEAQDLANIEVEGTDSFIVYQGPNMVITVSVSEITLGGGNSSPIPGATITYLLSYTNAGDTLAQNVVIDNVIPANATYFPNSAQVVSGPSATITYSHDGGNTYDNSQTPPVTNVRWEISGQVSPNEGGELTLQVTID